jgi:hypothetical protein
MDEKILVGLISIITALSPIIINYIFKRLENRNENNLRSTILDEAQKRFDFLSKYFQVQSNFLEGAKLADLKTELSAEAVQIKKDVVLRLPGKEIVDPYKLSVFQRVFLTFKPLTVWGWILHFFIYVVMILFFFMMIGFLVDSKSGELSFVALKKSFSDSGWFVFLMPIIILVVLRWRALVSHDKAVERKKLLSKQQTADIDRLKPPVS